MGKPRPTTSESHDTSSSEDELQIVLYTDMLERLTVEQNDSSDSDSSTKKATNCSHR